MAATKPLTTEAIALTEKKMDMTLGMIAISSPFCYFDFPNEAGYVIEYENFSSRWYNQDVGENNHPREKSSKASGKQGMWYFSFKQCIWYFGFLVSGSFMPMNYWNLFLIAD